MKRRRPCEVKEHAAELGQFEPLPVLVVVVVVARVALSLPAVVLEPVLLEPPYLRLRPPLSFGLVLGLVVVASTAADVTVLVRCRLVLAILLSWRSGGGGEPAVTSPSSPGSLVSSAPTVRRWPTPLQSVACSWCVRLWLWSSVVHRSRQWTGGVGSVGTAVAPGAEGGGSWNQEHPVARNLPPCMQRLVLDKQGVAAVPWAYPCRTDLTNLGRATLGVGSQYPLRTGTAATEDLAVEQLGLERDRVGIAGQLARLLVVVQLGPTGENRRSCRSPEISRVVKSGRRIGDSGMLYLSFLLSILSSAALASGSVTGSTYLMLKSILVMGAAVVVVVVVVRVERLVATASVVVIGASRGVVAVVVAFEAAALGSPLSGISFDLRRLPPVVRGAPVVVRTGSVVGATSPSATCSAELYWLYAKSGDMRDATGMDSPGRRVYFFLASLLGRSSGRTRSGTGVVVSASSSGVEVAGSGVVVVVTVVLVVVVVVVGGGVVVVVVVVVGVVSLEGSWKENSAGSVYLCMISRWVEDDTGAGSVVVVVEVVVVVVLVVLVLVVVEAVVAAAVVVCCSSVTPKNGVIVSGGSSSAGSSVAAPNSTLEMRSISCCGATVCGSASTGGSSVVGKPPFSASNSPSSGMVDVSIHHGAAGHRPSLTVRHALTVDVVVVAALRDRVPGAVAAERGGGAAAAGRTAAPVGGPVRLDQPDHDLALDLAELLHYRQLVRVAGVLGVDLHHPLDRDVLVCPVGRRQLDLLLLGAVDLGRRRYRLVLLVDREHVVQRGRLDGGRRRSTTVLQYIDIINIDIIINRVDRVGRIQCRVLLLLLLLVVIVVVVVVVMVVDGVVSSGEALLGEAFEAIALAPSGSDSSGTVVTSPTGGSGVVSDAPSAASVVVSTGSDATPPRAPPPYRADPPMTPGRGLPATLMVVAAARARLIAPRGGTWRTLLRVTNCLRSLAVVGYSRRSRRCRRGRGGSLAAKDWPRASSQCEAGSRCGDATGNRCAQAPNASAGSVRCRRLVAADVAERPPGAGGDGAWRRGRRRAVRGSRARLVVLEDEPVAATARRDARRTGADAGCAGASEAGGASAGGRHFSRGARPLGVTVAVALQAIVAVGAERTRELLALPLDLVFTVVLLAAVPTLLRGRGKSRRAARVVRSVASPSVNVGGEAVVLVVVVVRANRFGRLGSRPDVRLIDFCSTGLAATVALSNESSKACGRGGRLREYAGRRRVGRGASGAGLRRSEGTNGAGEPLGDVNGAAASAVAAVVTAAAAAAGSSVVVDVLSRPLRASEKDGRLRRVGTNFLIGSVGSGASVVRYLPVNFRRVVPAPNPLAAGLLLGMDSDSICWLSFSGCGCSLCGLRLGRPRVGRTVGPPAIRFALGLASVEAVAASVDSVSVAVSSSSPAGGSPSAGRPGKLSSASLFIRSYGDTISLDVSEMTVVKSELAALLSG
uniref:Uncharacterized protein n=1 Tax=Anopheles atroparvus TaxID=41427 RepID=A0A182J4H0_ANOAO